MTSIWDRNATASSNTSSPPAGFPESQNASLVDDQFRAEMSYQTEFVHSVVAGGTADALTVTYTNVPASLTDGMQIHVRAASANATTTPTLNVNALGAKTITKSGGAALAAGDIAGANHELILRYNSTAAHWELLNPGSTVQGPASSTANDIPKFSDTTGKVLADGYTVGTAANNLVQLTSASKLPAVDGSLLTNVVPGLSPTSATLGADVTLTTSYQTILSLTLGTGTWALIGHVTVNNSASGLICQWEITDGTTVFGAGFTYDANASTAGFAVNALVTNPAAAVTLKVAQTASSGGTNTVKFNASNSGKDTQIFAIRVA